MRNFHFEISPKIIKKSNTFGKPFWPQFPFVPCPAKERSVRGGIPADWSPVLICSWSGGHVGPSPDPGHLQPLVGMGYGPVSPEHPAATPAPPPGHHGALVRDGHGLWHIGTLAEGQGGHPDTSSAAPARSAPAVRDWPGSPHRLPSANGSWVALSGCYPALICTPTTAEGLSDTLPAASPELFSQRWRCRLADMYHYAVWCGQCWQRGWVLPLKLGRGELVELLSEEMSGLRVAAGVDVWPRACGVRAARGWAEEPGAWLCWEERSGGTLEKWLLAHQLSFSCRRCVWPVVPLLRPSKALIPPVTLQVAWLSADMAAEVPPWRRAGSLRSPPSLDVLLGHGSAGGTQQLLQQR